MIFNEDKVVIRNNNSTEKTNVMRKLALSTLARARKKPYQSIRFAAEKKLAAVFYLVDSVNPIFHA